MEDKQTHHQTKICIFEVCDISSVYLAGFAPRTHLLYCKKANNAHHIQKQFIQYYSSIDRGSLVHLYIYYIER